MGVMGCHRYGCKNIMCDRYSSKHGYICNECFGELCDSLSIPSHKRIKEFMKKDKSDSDLIDKDEIYRILDKEFRFDRDGGL